MALCPGLPGWASTKKEKPIWILLKQDTVSGDGISWAICKSAPCSRQIPHQLLTAQFFTGRMPFLPPNQQRQSTEGLMQSVYLNKYVVSIAPFSTPACPNCSQNIQKTALFCMISLFNFSSISSGGQLTQFAPMCGRPCHCSSSLQHSLVLLYFVLLSFLGVFRHIINYGLKLHTLHTYIQNCIAPKSWKRMWGAGRFSDNIGYVSRCCNRWSTHWAPLWLMFLVLHVHYPTYVFCCRNTELVQQK